MTYASRNEPSETTGPYKSEEEFIFSHLKGEKPTLLFRRGDFIGGHDIDLVDLFPLIITSVGVYHIFLITDINSRVIVEPY